MPDSSAIGNALIAKLGAHQPLLALMPNGIYEDVAPEGSTKFVIVSYVIGFDTGIFNGRAAEEHTYLVEARALSTGGGDVRSAATVIDNLLDPQPPNPPATLTVPGYAVMTIRRDEFVRGREVDAVDPNISWSRRGGRYTVMCSL
jgi:hypothetical protein